MLLGSVFSRFPMKPISMPGHHDIRKTAGPAFIQAADEVARWREGLAKGTGACCAADIWKNVSESGEALRKHGNKCTSSDFQSPGKLRKAIRKGTAWSKLRGSLRLPDKHVFCRCVAVTDYCSADEGRFAGIAQLRTYCFGVQPWVFRKV